MLDVLRHHRRFLRLKDADISLQRLIALLKSSIRELGTAQVASNLLLFLVAGELESHFLFFTPLLVQLCQRVLMLLTNTVFIGSHGLDLLILSVGDSLELFVLLRKLITLVLDESQLVLACLLILFKLHLLEALLPDGDFVFLR